LIGGKIRLAQDHVRGCPIAGRQAVIDQDPAVSRVSHEELCSVGCDPVRARQAGSRGRRLVGELAGKRNLPDHLVGRGVIGRGNGVENQHPVIESIADEKLASPRPNPIGTVQAVRPREAVALVGVKTREVHLPHLEISRGPVRGGNGRKNQNSRVESVRHEKLGAVAGNIRGGIHAPRPRRVAGLGEIILAQDDTGVWTVGRGHGSVQDNPVVLGIRYHQGRSRGADSIGSAQGRSGGPRRISGNRGLAHHYVGRLSV